MRARLAIALTGLVLAAGVALGQARLGPYVIDANGLKVGHVQDQSTILLFIDGVPTAIAAGPNGLTPSGLTLLFMGGDCDTQALLGLPASPFPFFLPGFYTTDGVVHYANPANLVSTTVNSAVFVHTDGSMDPCGPAGNPAIVAPELTAPPPSFTLPLSVVDTLPVSAAPGTATFNDVPTTHPFFRYIEALHAAGITGGCSVSPPLYCPNNSVTRGQMAVFLAKALGL